MVWYVKQDGIWQSQICQKSKNFLFMGPPVLANIRQKFKISWIKSDLQYTFLKIFIFFLCMLLKKRNCFLAISKIRYAGFQRKMIGRLTTLWRFVQLHYRHSRWWWWFDDFMVPICHNAALYKYMVHGMPSQHFFKSFFMPKIRINLPAISRRYSKLRL